jgi:hypothetical protein
MKQKNLSRYATDTQEKQQLRLKKKRKGGKTSDRPVMPKAPRFETTGGKNPVTLNKRKGKTY